MYVHHARTKFSVNIFYYSPYKKKITKCNISFLLRLLIYDRPCSRQKSFLSPGKLTSSRSPPAFPHPTQTCRDVLGESNKTSETALQPLRKGLHSTPMSYFRHTIDFQAVIGARLRCTVQVVHPF